MLRHTGSCPDWGLFITPREKSSHIPQKLNKSDLLISFISQASWVKKQSVNLFIKFKKWLIDHANKLFERIGEIYQPSQESRVPINDLDFDIKDEPNGILNNVTKAGQINEEKLTKIDVKSLGRYLDGWADLIEGMGNKDADIRTSLLLSLINRKIPNSRIVEACATLGFDLNFET